MARPLHFIDQFLRGATGAAARPVGAWQGLAVVCAGGMA